MKKKYIAVVLVAVLLAATMFGCGPKKANEKPAKANNRKPQLVVAMNPILVYGDGTNQIAFNDIKNAISADRKAATLTAISDTTNLVWTYKQGENWKKRGTYGLDKWRNCDYVSADRLSAYSFVDDGTVSLMPYTTKAAQLTTYQNEEPESAGILLSVSGTEKEALCYQIEKSGQLMLPAGKMTAIESVGGIKTGFLAEDGTERSAVVQFIINTRVVWQGQFANSTAAGGTAITELNYGDITGINVEAGDKFFISVQLDALPNRDEDVAPEEDNGNTSTDDFGGNSTTKPNENPTNNGTKPEKEKIQSLSLIDDYDSRFSIVYSADATIPQKQIITMAREKMVGVLEADVHIGTDKDKAAEYEILIGQTGRSESKKVYNDLLGYRANNGADYIIRMVGNKLVIAANTDYSLKMAVEYFLANYVKSDKDSIPGDLNYVYRPKLSNIYIGNGSIASYTIRTEKYPSVMVIRAAEKLDEYIVSKTGYYLKIEKDTQKTDNEILIGLTTRSGISAGTFKTKSLDFVKGKRGNVYSNEEYNIFMDGTKLFVEAGSDYAANIATLKLIDYLKKNGKFAAITTLNGSYEKGSYDLIDNYAYTWGDEFFSSSGTAFSKKNWKVMEKGYTENNGPWYKKDDPYYLASLKSLNDADPTNDFGGPWVDSGNAEYVQEGTSKNLAANAQIQDNMLVQTAEKSVNGYTGSVLCTDGRMEFRYGILEARILPSTANGTAGCFWTRTKDGGSVVNEIDIFENFGEDKLRPNLHTWPNGGTHVDHGEMITLRKTLSPAKNEHFYDTFHHIAVEWTPEFINMYLDGEIYLSQQITGDTWYAFRETTYVIFNTTSPSKTYAHNGNPGNFLAGGNVDPMKAAKLFDTNGDGKVDVSDFCEKQYVDYVRLYQINSRQYSLKAKK